MQADHGREHLLRVLEMPKLLETLTKCRAKTGNVKRRPPTLAKLKERLLSGKEFPGEDNDEELSNQGQRPRNALLVNMAGNMALFQELNSVLKPKSFTPEADDESQEQPEIKRPKKMLKKSNMAFIDELNAKLKLKSQN